MDEIVRSLNPCDDMTRHLYMGESFDPIAITYNTTPLKNESSISNLHLHDETQISSALILFVTI